MRILLLADDCNPEWPSLPVVGFKMWRALASQADVVLATHVRNRENIERVGLSSAAVEYIDNEYIAAPIYKLSTLVRGGNDVAWTTGIAMSYPYYLAFEYEASRRFGTALRRGEFDVVHRITPMSPTLPSLMASRCPVPFVLGPLNGGLRWPRHFGGELRREREWLTHIRGAYRLLPYYRSTYKHAAAVIAAFDHTIADLPSSARERTISLPEVGFDPALFSSAAPRVSSERATFLYVGRLVPYKCPDVLVDAFAKSPLLRRHRLLIAGDGPERARLEQAIAAHRLESCVELLGRRTQSEVGKLMGEADVFAFPSIRELGAGVVVEAMASGLPCIVVNYGGPGGLVNDTCGVRVPLGDRSALVEAFTAEMERLAANPSLRLQLGSAAASIAAREYSWTAKAQKILRVYEWVLGRTSARPSF